jgi:hypothetical protein
MKRWIRFHLPVMVLVDVSDTVEDKRILQIVGCTDSVQPAEDLDGQTLMYDTEMRASAPPPAPTSHACRPRSICPGRRPATGSSPRTR